MKSAQKTSSPGKVWNYTLATGIAWSILLSGLLTWCIFIEQRHLVMYSHEEHVRILSWSFALVWFFGLIGFSCGGWYASRRVRDHLRDLKALRESEENLRFVLATSANDLFYEWDVKTNTMEWIGDIEGVLGYEQGSIPRTIEGWLDLIHPDDKIKVAATMQNGSTTPFDISYRVRQHNGKLQYWEEKGLAIVDALGKPSRVTSVCTDVTERHRADEALRESEERFMDVLLKSNDAILLIDGETFVECNRATTQMLGYVSRQEFLMTHPSKLSPPKQPDGRDSFEKANDMMQTAMDKGYHRFQWQHLRANGEEFPVEVSLTPIKFQGRTVLYCLWRDLSEQNQVVENLQLQNDDLRRQVKKLSVTCSIFRSADQTDASPEEMFQDIVEKIPAAMRHPGFASARITLGEKVFHSSGFSESLWSMEACLIVNDTPRGLLEVFYQREKPETSDEPFLEEEKRLVEAIARSLVHIIEQSQS